MSAMYIAKRKLVSRHYTTTAGTTADDSEEKKRKKGDLKKRWEGDLKTLTIPSRILEGWEKGGYLTENVYIANVSEYEDGDDKVHTPCLLVIPGNSPLYSFSPGDENEFKNSVRGLAEDIKMVLEDHYTAGLQAAFENPSMFFKTPHDRLYRESLRGFIDKKISEAEKALKW